MYIVHCNALYNIFTQHTGEQQKILLIHHFHHFFACFQLFQRKKMLDSGVVNCPTDDLCIVIWISVFIQVRNIVQRYASSGGAPSLLYNIQLSTIMQRPKIIIILRMKSFVTYIFYICKINSFQYWIRERYLNLPKLPSLT